MGRSTFTAFRLGGIRARGDAAESDEAMTSNDTKKKARRLQQENPGMKYTEALRRVGARPPMLDFVPKSPPTLKAFMDAVAVASHKAKIVNIDPSAVAEQALHDLIRKARTPRYSGEHASLSEIIDRLDDGGRAPWPIQVGYDFADWTPSVLYPLEDGGNLAICGEQARGENPLVALADSALNEGWVLSALMAGTEYRNVRSRKRQARTSTTCEQTYENETPSLSDFLRAVTPGDEGEPRMVLIEGDRHVPGDDESGEWVEDMERLMAHPHTTVILQVASIERIPVGLLPHFRTRLLVGDASRQTQESVFEGVASRENLNHFEFDDPEWPDMALGAGKGVLWNGEDLRAIWTPLPGVGGAGTAILR